MGLGHEAGILYTCKRSINWFKKKKKDKKKKRSINCMYPFYKIFFLLSKNLALEVVSEAYNWSSIILCHLCNYVILTNNKLSILSKA